MDWSQTLEFLLTEPNFGSYNLIAKGCVNLHTIKYKKCLAQQDNKTFEVTISILKCANPNIVPTLAYPCKERLSAKELRSYVNRYLSDIVNTTIV